MSDLIPCVGGPLDGQFYPDYGPGMVYNEPPEMEQLDVLWHSRNKPVHPIEYNKHEYRKERVNIGFRFFNVFMPFYCHIPYEDFRILHECIIKCFLAFSHNDTVLPWDFPASLGRFGKGTPIPIVRDWFEEWKGYPNFGICSILTMIENRTLVSVCGPKVFPSWQEAILSLDFRRDR